MGIAQRYVRAAGSGNLRTDAQHFDTEVLMAVALTSAFGGLLFRVKYFNDAASYRNLLHEWTWKVSCKAKRRNWPDNVDIGKVASLSLNRFLNSVCPVCTGRREETVFNTPMLSGQACRICEGSGQAPLTLSQPLRDYVLDMIEELAASHNTAGALARKKLGRASEA